MIESTTFWLSRTFIVALAVATLIPYLPTGAWAVRLLDFPRVQLLALAGLSLVLLLVQLGIRQKLDGSAFIALAVWIAVVACQFWHISPFTPLWPKDLADSNGSQGIKIMVANIEYSNANKPAVRDVLEEAAPDILLLIEIDDEWRESLREVEQSYKYGTNVIRDNGLGISLWSHLPLEDVEVNHLVSESRASIFATIEMPNGDRARFVGLHPTPPGLPDDQEGGRHDSRIRDAELMLVAKHVQQNTSLPWIVAGDFNDVAWSHTTRLFKRQSGLKDPRVGRSLLNTFHSEYVWMRYPIDQVFLTEGSTIARLDRIYLPGSDHFAVIAQLSVPESGVSQPATEETQKEASELIQEGKEDAN